MVLGKWIITPIKVGWIRPVSRCKLTQLTIDRYDHFQPDTLVPLVKGINYDIAQNMMGIPFFKQPGFVNASKNQQLNPF